MKKLNIHYISDTQIFFHIWKVEILVGSLQGIVRHFFMSWKKEHLDVSILVVKSYFPSMI